ncbi:hypothetical protein O93_01227 [Bartonella quintana JK 19]|nr:hypothetical protein O93_01227 [Bartonella quintana JK 19]
MVSEGFIVFAFAMEDFLRCLFLLKNSKKETSLGYQEVLIVRFKKYFRMVLLGYLSTNQYCIFRVGMFASLDWLKLYY